MVKPIPSVVQRTTNPYEYTHDSILYDLYFVAFAVAVHLISGQNHASIQKVVELVIEDTSFGVRLTL